jgi:glutaconate CoA-transferase, subunit B
MMAESYTPGELMVAAAAREIGDGEVVFVGMRLPMLAFAVAKHLHAPEAVGFFELGLVREDPASGMLYTMGDNPNYEGATWATQTTWLMGSMARGEVEVGFIGGAQIDRYGNLNTSYIGSCAAPSIRLPGSGGAADIASLSRRLVLIMAHEKRRFVERVDYITSPGYGDGKDWRQRTGLPGGGPSAVITTLGILRFDDDGEAYLESHHPHVSPEEVCAATGWHLAVSPDVRSTPAPSDEELAIIRRYDPDGFWSGKF